MAHQEAMSESVRKAPAAAPAAAVSWKFWSKFSSDSFLACLLMQIIKSKPSKTRRYIPRHRESVIQNSHAARQKRDDHAHARDKMRERTSHLSNTQEYRVCFLSVFASCLKVERQSAFFGRFRTDFLNRPEPRTRRYRWLAGFKGERRRSCFP